MGTDHVFATLTISLGLGLLVGLQRERAGSRLAGIRTFPLITLLGALAALTGQVLGGWVVGAGFLAVAATTGVGSYLLLKQEQARETGMTTEIAVLVMYAVGAYTAVGEPAAALAAGVAVAVLLYSKGPMHGLAARIGEKDMGAIMLLAAITFVVLPVLPDRTFGPLDVLNPHHIWLMVVLVVGMSLGGYVAYKALGARAGAVVAGLLGGLISSTATTVTFARRSRENGAYLGPAVVVIMLASGVVYVRVLVEIAVVAQEFWRQAAVPVGVMLAVSAGVAGAAWLIMGRNGDALPEPENPTELKSALMFAVLYAAVLLAVAWGKEHLGTGGVYGVAALSGLTDMDAITLSTARLVEEGGMAASAGWRAIVIAAMSNMVFKLVVIAGIGGRGLIGRVGPLLAIKLGAALALVALWP